VGQRSLVPRLPCMPSSQTGSASFFNLMVARFACIIRSCKRPGLRNGCLLYPAAIEWQSMRNAATLHAPGEDTRMAPHGYIYASLHARCICCDLHAVCELQVAKAVRMTAWRVAVSAAKVAALDAMIAMAAVESCMLLYCISHWRGMCASHSRFFHRFRTCCHACLSRHTPSDESRPRSPTFKRNRHRLSITGTLLLRLMRRRRASGWHSSFCPGSSRG